MKPNISSLKMRFSGTPYVAIMCLWLCGAAVVVAAEDSASLTIAVADAPTTLDARYATGAASARILRLVTAPLLEVSEDGSLHSRLLESWQQTDDTTYIFTLKKGLRYDDGSAVSAETVAAFLNHLKDPDVGAANVGVLAEAAHITAIDNSVFKIQLKKYNPWFLHGLQDILIVKLQHKNTEHPLDPIGVGGLTLHTKSALGNVVLADAAHGKSYTFQVVKDPMVRLLKLERGEVDVVYNDLPVELYSYGLAQGFEGLSTPAASYTYIGFNLQQGPTAQAAVRQAVSLAINRAAIMQHLLNGLASPAESLLMPEHEAFWPAPLDYNPEQAKKLLDDAGFLPNDKGIRLSLRLSITNNPFIARVAQVLQQQLGQVGIELKLDTAEWGTFYGNIKQGNFEAYILSWVGVFRPDIYYYVFHSSQVPPAGANRGFLNDAQMDALLDTLMYSKNASERLSASLAAQQRQHQQMFYAPLWRRDHLMLSRPGVTNCALLPDGGYEGLLQCQKGSAAR